MSVTEPIQWAMLLYADPDGKYYVCDLDGGNSVQISTDFNRIPTGHLDTIMTPRTAPFMVFAGSGSTREVLTRTPNKAQEFVNNVNRMVRVRCGLQ